MSNYNYGIEDEDEDKNKILKILGVLIFVAVVIVILYIIIVMLKGGFHNNVQNVLNSPDLLILPRSLHYNKVNVPLV